MENQNVLNVDDAIKSQVMPYLPRLAKPLMKSLIVQWTMHKHIFFSPFLMLLVFKIVQKPGFPTLFLEFILQLQCDASEIDHWLQKVEYYLPQFLAFIDQKDKALIPMQLFISLLKSKCLGNVHC